MLKTRVISKNAFSTIVNFTIVETKIESIDIMKLDEINTFGQKERIF